VDLTETSSDGSTRSFSTTKVAARYVRREIRTLTDEDRESYLNAIEQVHRLSAEEGVSTYGANFSNYEPYTAVHNSVEYCYHTGQVSVVTMPLMAIDRVEPTPRGPRVDDGLMTIDLRRSLCPQQFFTVHAGFQLWLEKSLHAIDPAISSPYFDFFVVSGLRGTCKPSPSRHTTKHEPDPLSPLQDGGLYGNEWHKSIIFNDDWFGRVATEADEGYVVTQGRFAYLPVSKGAEENVGSTTNSFGYTTSPNDNFVSSYITRYAEAPKDSPAAPGAPSRCCQA
jgi:hypothetical protein